MNKFRFYVISIILFLSFLLTIAQKNETVDIKASAKPFPKGNKIILKKIQINIFLF
jgi:hypothetical protein